MAFPPNLGEEEYYGQIIREEIQNKPYEGLTQNSAHNKNFMFGEAYLGGLEHEPGMPVLKLIDFGRGKIETEETSIERLPNNPTQYGSSKNLSGAAQVLMRLACVGPEIAFPQMNRVIMYNYTDEFGIERSVQTRAPAILRQNTVMDPQLRHMLVRCLAYPHAFRPTLQEVLDETVAAVRDRGPTYPGLLTEDAIRGGVSETDDAIRDFLQRFIYDPPPPPGR
ncbi:hypothetical protein F5Y08DRAFT_337833 [Xylaria arbuscula]|nr:hypothetical protein F5Y08DRAFT_337833 [Xylaria arbuscula]